MLNPPRTRAEAEKRRYGGWRAGGIPSVPFDPEHCAVEVWPLGYVTPNHAQQCFRAPGHGPDSLYCRQHAKMVEAGE